MLEEGKGKGEGDTDVRAEILVMILIDEFLPFSLYEYISQETVYVGSKCAEALLESGNKKRLQNQIALPVCYEYRTQSTNVI